jgi:hypothetical protein
LLYWSGCCSELIVDYAYLCRQRSTGNATRLRPDSSVVERGPEKAGQVGGAILFWARLWPPYFLQHPSLLSFFSTEAR